MKKRVIIYFIILLIIPLAISIYLGSKNRVKENDNLVIYEADNAEKIDLNKINNQSRSTSIYISIFVLLSVTGGLFIYAENKKN